jgi:hypothetical protein
VSVKDLTISRNIDNAYFNDDAYMDLIVLDNNTNAIRVYLGTGTGKFSHKDQHFATNPQHNSHCPTGKCLSDSSLIEMFDYINLYRSDAAQGIATPAYSELTKPSIIH